LDTALNKLNVLASLASGYQPRDSGQKDWSRYPAAVFTGLHPKTENILMIDDASVTNGELNDLRTLQCQTSCG